MLVYDIDIRVIVHNDIDLINFGEREIFGLKECYSGYALIIRLIGRTTE